MIIYLLGDSIIDNNPYTSLGNDVTSLWQKRLDAKSSSVTLNKLAIDGATVTSTRMVQVPKLKESLDSDVGRAMTVVFSAGGNDLNNAYRGSLGDIDSLALFLQETFPAMLDALKTEYSRLISDLREVVGTDASIYALKIYPIYVPDEEARRYVNGAIKKVNTIIEEVSAEQKIKSPISLDHIKDEECFVQQIEPSDKGGHMIVDALEKSLGV